MLSSATRSPWELTPLLLSCSVPAPPVCRCAPPRAAATPLSIIEQVYGGQAPAARYVASEDTQLPLPGGETPPADLTYGEVDLEYFAALLDTVAPQPGETFVDIGSGCGRLVGFAALLHPWRTAVGIEVVRGLHEEALALDERLVEAAAGMPISPREYICEMAEAELPVLAPATREEEDKCAGSADRCVAFLYATTWPCGPGFRLEELSAQAQAPASITRPLALHRFFFASLPPCLPCRLTQRSSSLPQLGRALPLGSRVIVVGRRLLGSDPSGRRAWAFDEIGKWSWSNEATGQSASAFAYERVHPGQAQGETAS